MQNFFEKVYYDVDPSETEILTFWMWGYDTTSWANIESAIDADCLEINRLEARTCWSCQRKTFYEGSNENHWRFSYDETEIDIDYSTNASDWTAESSLSYNTNDFSVWENGVQPKRSATKNSSR